MLVLACTTDYQKGLEDPNFGAPNALAGFRQPGPTSSTPDTPGAAGASIPECVKAGGALVDAGTCNVSFKTDVLGAFLNAACNQTSGCHGGASPASLPRIDPADAPGMYTEF